MRWIDRKSYVGVDRRKRRPSLIYGERRQDAAPDVSLSLGAALRQLRVLARAANKARGVGEFVTRTQAVAELAHARGEAELGAALLRLAEQVAAASAEDWRARLEDVLGRLSQRFDAIA